MAATSSSETRTEAVGIFHDAKTFQAAIDDLLVSGFDRSELSLLAGEKTVNEKLGHMYLKVEELEDDQTVPRAAYISTETRGDAQGGLIGGLAYIGAVAAVGAIVMTGGALATVIVGAVIAGGVGGLVGTSLAGVVGHHHAKYMEEQIDHGGLILWVRTTSGDREELAKEILTKHSAHDVHLHTLESSS